MNNKTLKYYLGLDLGITSVGWAVMAQDPKTKKHTLHDFGVRLFKAPEDPKSLKTKATERREFRSARRLNRRKKYRIQQLKKLLAKSNFLTFSQYQEQFKKTITNKIILDANDQWTTAPNLYNPDALKAQALEGKISKADLYAILINYCKKRGYADKFSFELDEEVETEAKTKKNDGTKLTPAIEKAEALVKKYGSIAKAIIHDEEFHLVRTPDYRILYTNNSPKIFTKIDKNGVKKIYNYEKLDEKNKKLHKQPGFRWLFAREAYKNELQQILEQQSDYYVELKSEDFRDKIKEIVFQSRDFEVGAKCPVCVVNIFAGKKIPCPRPKACSKYGTFLDMIGKCEYFTDQYRGNKASIIFPMFLYVCELSKFLSFLKKVNIKLTADEYQTLLQNILVNNWERKQVRKLIENTADWKIHGKKEYFKVDMWQVKGGGLSLKTPAFWKTCLEIPQIKAKITKANFAPENLHTLDQHIIQQIGDVVSKWITPARRETKLLKVLEQHNINLSEKELVSFLKLKNTATGPANISLKFMLEAVRAFYKATPYGNFQADKQILKDKNLQEKFKSETEATVLFSKFPDKEMQKNPVVFRAINQARKVLKKLHQKYLKFESIVIEVARDLAKNAKERRKITDMNVNNAKINEAIINKLKENNITVNRKTILSYKLWKQQNGKCIYSERAIVLEKIDPNKRVVEIDHIFPQTKCADDSIHNKVLVFTEENQNKKNQIPSEYLKHRWESFKKAIAVLQNKRLSFSDKTDLKISNRKATYLLAKSVTEIIDGEFASRNLNDTRYITKYIHNYLLHEKKKHKMTTDVFAIQGAVISRLRRAWLINSPWGLDKKVREITPFHHAIDASVLCQFKKQTEIELAIDLAHLQNLTKRIQRCLDHPIRREIAEHEKSEFLKLIKRKWEQRHQTEYNAIITEADNKSYCGKSFYIHDLQLQLENRIPVKLTTQSCPDCHNTTDDKTKRLYCAECNGKGKIPKYQNILNQTEWEDSVQYLDSTNIDLHYPHISRMYSYKTRGAVASEVVGFTGQQKNLKNRLFRLWKNNHDISYKTVITSNEKKFKDLSEKKFKDWIKEFNEGKSFKLNKVGGVIELDSYYGVLLPTNKEEKPQWIRLIDAASNKELIKKRAYLLVPGKLIEYKDRKLEKLLIKTYSGKAGNQILIAPNGITKPKFETYQNIFGININYRDSMSNILNKWKILKVDILGRLE